MFLQGEWLGAGDGGASLHMPKGLCFSSPIGASQKFQTASMSALAFQAPLDLLGHMTHVTSLVAQRLKRLLAVRETWVPSLGQEDPLEKEMATHTSILAWRRKWQSTPVFLPGEGNGNPHHYSCLENPVDGGAWWATVHRVKKIRTRLSDFTKESEGLPW